MSDEQARTPTGALTSPGPNSAGQGTPSLSKETLDAVRQRDPEALRAFFDHFFPRVYRIAQRTARNKETAEDIAQEVFYRIYRAVERLDPERDPSGWVTTITLNTCRKHWASKAEAQARQTLGFEDREGIEERLPAAVANPQEILESSEQKGRLVAALDQLPEPMRETIVLHVYGGLGHDEIAEVLGIGHAAARKRYSRALARLGELLEEDGA